MDGAERAAVVGRSAVVTHHKDVQRRHPLGSILASGHLRQIGFVQGLAISVHPSIMHADNLARQADDSLDQELAIVATRLFENDDVASPRSVEVVGYLFHDQPLIRVQVRLHALSIDASRLGQEDVDQSGDQHRGNYCFQKLPQRCPPPSPSARPHQLAIGLMRVLRIHVLDAAAPAGWLSASAAAGAVPAGDHRHPIAGAIPHRPSREKCAVPLTDGDRVLAPLLRSNPPEQPGVRDGPYG